MDDKQKIDAIKLKVRPNLWREMKISAIRQGIKIHEWVEDAIEQKLKMEDKNEK